ncbi:hypothetical protein [Actinophytocola gossypii]|uniref:FUSC family protein n=1 Tax=Actinophytocola gossypii TaxID=2812003 RepID=A0ABT2J754_9PSEU|nr:hypothetical protein [Actinophytocola gossypii]MCT2583685.1 hypothetical protein [Actinophytocola gossypii]
MGRYLGSTKNLVGSACGLVGIVLYVTGVTGSYGLALVAVLYAAGALLAPPERVRRSPAAELPRLRADLAALVESAVARRADLPAGAVERLERIAGTLTPLMARPLGEDPETLHAVIRLAGTDLPLSVRTYLNLPRNLTARIDGRDHDPAAELLDQLELLERDANRIAARHHAGDVRQQTDHTRYIRSRTEPDEPGR